LRFRNREELIIFGVKKGESHNVGIKRTPPEEVKQNFENVSLFIIREIEERMCFALNSIEFYSLFCCDIINLCVKSSRIRI